MWGDLDRLAGKTAQQQIVQSRHVRGKQVYTSVKDEVLWTARSVEKPIGGVVESMDLPRARV